VAAIYHLSVKRIGGNGGRSSVGAAAYHSGVKMRNEYYGKIHDYTKRRGAIGAAAYHSGERFIDGNLALDFTQKSGIVYSEVMLPKHAPEIYRVSWVLWNSIEMAKKQHNEQTSRMIVVALPNELTPQQQIELVRDYVQRNFVNEGMCAHFSLHAGHIHEHKDQTYPFQDLAIRKDNPHAHIQLTMRPLNKDGTWVNKARKEYILDKNGERIRSKSGKEWRSRNIPLTDWEKPETLIKWREDWARTVNKEFERLGIDERIDHRSLKDQGIDREPTIHMGHKAWNLEKKGIKTERGNINRAIMARNKAREQQKREQEPSTRGKVVHIHDVQGVSHEPEPMIHKAVEPLEQVTHKPEPQTRDKLAFIKQATIQEPTMHEATPEATAEYIHELKQGYIAIDWKASEIQQKIREAECEKMVTLTRAKELDERAKEINMRHKHIKDLMAQCRKSRLPEVKKAIDRRVFPLLPLHERAVSRFTSEYGITTKEAQTEIRRFDDKMAVLEQKVKSLRDSLPPLLVDREALKLKYHRLLADIDRDREQFYERLEQLDKETRDKLSPKGLITYAQCKARLDKVSDQEFEKILQDMLPKQRETLTKERECEKVREHGREHTR